MININYFQSGTKIDYLYQYFYIFGIEPESIKLSDFIEQNRNYLNPDFLKVKLLTKYPNIDNIESNINENIIINHCFPKGSKIILNNSQPPEEYFHFKLNNVLSFDPRNKFLYFTCIILFEPLQSYLDLSNQKINKNQKIPIEQLYVVKALCFSSFESFPYETRNLAKDLISYVNSNKITIPIEKIIENIIYGIPRPLRSNFCVKCTKSN